MSNLIVNDTPQLTGVAFPPYKPTEKQRKALQNAKKTLDRFDCLLGQVADLKQFASDLSSQLLNGKVDLATAAPMLALSSSPEKRTETANTLRGHMKNAAKLVLESLAPVFDSERECQIEHLESLCKSTEASERSALTAAGIDQDRFEPSAFLNQMRQTRKVLLDTAPNISTGDIDRLLN